MARPSTGPTEPRKGSVKVAETPEMLAKRATDRRPSPPGQPDKVEFALRLVLARAVLERLSARAIREGRNVQDVMVELLERSAG